MNNSVSTLFSPMSQTMATCVKTIQQQIVEGLNTVEKNTFKTDVWARAGGGGGVTKVIENGRIIEKGGVNISEVYGQISEKEAPMFTMLLEQQGVPYPKKITPHFFATGISVVLHPKNPMVPTIHANYRYFEMQTDAEPIWWFGGGTDLTPYYLFEEDVTHFHQTYKTTCDLFDTSFYPTFKKRCDEYFYLPHRKETRGLGGIFFDYFNQLSKEESYHFVSACADAFLPSYIPIIEKRRAMPFTEQQRQWQQLRRGRYVEFNLLYDRGTLFGLKTNGRIESILMSLPNQAAWAYDFKPKKGSEEETFLHYLRFPQKWCC